MNRFQDIILLPVMLTLFDGEFDYNTQTTGSDGLSAEMKVFYSDYLIDLAEPELVHDQFGTQYPRTAARSSSSGSMTPCPR